MNMVDRAEIGPRSSRKAVANRQQIQKQLKDVINCLNQAASYNPSWRCRLDVRAAKKFEEDTSMVPSFDEYRAQAQRQAERLQTYIEMWKRLRATSTTKSSRKSIRKRMAAQYP